MHLQLRCICSIWISRRAARLDCALRSLNDVSTDSTLASATLGGTASYSEIALQPSAFRILEGTEQNQEQVDECPDSEKSEGHQHQDAGSSLPNIKAMNAKQTHEEAKQQGYHPPDAVRVLSQCVRHDGAPESYS